jgi:iron(III) transport system substrate-binding protein
MSALTLIAAMAGACLLAAAQRGHAAEAIPSRPPAQVRPEARALAQNQLEALVKAAKAEGELTFYSRPTENVANRIRDAFARQYGIRSQYLRLGGTPLQQRYSAEAEAGTFVADVILNAGNSVEYAEDGIRKGWLEPVSGTGLPVITSGEFPAPFLPGPTAIIQVSPWGIGYNTDKLAAADVPKDWADILAPRFRGQVIITDPRASGAQLDHWSLVLDKYGESFFSRLRGQNPRQYSGGVPSTNALAAGEGSIQVPAILAQVQAVKDKGAPVAWVAIDHSTGVEIQVTLTARAKSRHPNAGRLFANYLMSREGNQVVNDDPGGMTIYDTARLPANYVSPKPGASARQAQFVKLLGF